LTILLTLAKSIAVPSKSALQKAASILGSVRSVKKTEAARRNAKLPRKKKKLWKKLLQGASAPINRKIAKKIVEAHT
jgi:hypothetical protein